MRTFDLAKFENGKCQRWQRGLGDKNKKTNILKSTDWKKIMFSIQLIYLRFPHASYFSVLRDKCISELPVHIIRLRGLSTLPVRRENKHCKVLLSCSGQKIQTWVFSKPSGTFRNLQELSGTFRNLQEPSGTFRSLIFSIWLRTDGQTDISSSRAAPSQLKILR